MNPVQSMFIRWGDRVGIVWGGQVYADYMYKQYRKEINKETGKKHTHKEAHDKALRDFETFAEASQQSSRATNISRWRAQGGDAVKPFTMFTSAMTQVHQISAQAAREIIRRKDMKKNAKILATSHVLLGQLFALAGNSFKWDDEKQGWALVLGHAEGIAVAGKLLSTWKNTKMGEKGFKLF